MFCLLETKGQGYNPLDFSSSLSAPPADPNGDQMQWAEKCLASNISMTESTKE